MSRIPSHTVEDAPEASRPLLQRIAQASPTGRPLNLHAQMAHSPAVLAAYASLRAITVEHGTFDPKVSAAITLAASVAIANDYVIGITSRLALMNGWSRDQVAALQAGTTTQDSRVDALVDLVNEASVNAGKVSDTTWTAALRAGWSDEQLTDAFAFVGLTLYTGYFLNYAQTVPDV